MTSALKGDYGPLAQAVAKYQTEQKIKKMLEKYKVNSEKVSKSKDLEKNEKKVLIMGIRKRFE